MYLEEEKRIAGLNNLEKKKNEHSSEDRNVNKNRNKYESDEMKEIEPEFEYENSLEEDEG